MNHSSPGTLLGYCSIEWSATSDLYGFSLTGNTFTAVGDGTLGTTAASLTGVNCTTDFVVIPAPILSSNSSYLNTDRFCGNGFPSVICKNVASKVIGSTFAKFRCFSLFEAVCAHGGDQWERGERHGKPGIFLVFHAGSVLWRLNFRKTINAN